MTAVGIPPDTVIGQKYRINRKIGSGSFGEIWYMLLTASTHLRV